MFTPRNKNFKRWILKIIFFEMDFERNLAFPENVTKFQNPSPEKYFSKSIS